MIGKINLEKVKKWFLDIGFFIVIISFAFVLQSASSGYTSNSENIHREALIERSLVYIKENPGTSSVEVWELTGDKWYCKLSAGKFNLCAITPSFPDDKWAKSTSQRILEEGWASKSIDGNATFTKYVKILGVGYNFVKFDTAGGTRVVFISKKPFNKEAMERFLRDYGYMIDSL